MTTILKHALSGLAAAALLASASLDASTR